MEKGLEGWFPSQRLINNDENMDNKNQGELSRERDGKRDGRSKTEDGELRLTNAQLTIYSQKLRARKKGRRRLVQAKSHCRQLNG
jgi:hypothetical protein